MKPPQVVIALLAAGVIGAVVLVGAARGGASSNDVGAAPRGEGASSELRALDDATTWINSPPLSASALRGKVVLVEFWTYTCINWLRTLPYTRAWSDRYGSKGLVVIGVHSPEFSFEHELVNVRTAAHDLRVDYPIAVDNDFAIWRAFDNNAWPALYLIDAQGRIRHEQVGEGGYGQTERVIQQLLAEAGARDIDRDLVTISATGVEAAADWAHLKSAENYLGYGRTESFASPGGVVRDRATPYRAPQSLALNQWAVTGTWTMKSPAAVLTGPTGSIRYRFHARDVHLVMGPATDGAPIRFRVTLDGAAPGAAHGGDTDAEGNGVVREPRMYQLIRQPGAIVERTVEIEFLDRGVEAYAFTFG